jgi:hypothetical protein
MCHLCTNELDPELPWIKTFKTVASNAKRHAVLKGEQLIEVFFLARRGTVTPAQI